jgi:hypothetical protein
MNVEKGGRQQAPRFDHPDDAGFFHDIEPPAVVAGIDDGQRLVQPADHRPEFHNRPSDRAGAGRRRRSRYKDGHRYTGARQHAPAPHRESHTLCSLFCIQKPMQKRPGNPGRWQYRPMATKHPLLRPPSAHCGAKTS